MRNRVAVFPGHFPRAAGRVRPRRKSLSCGLNSPPGRWTYLRVRRGVRGRFPGPRGLVSSGLMSRGTSQAMPGAGTDRTKHWARRPAPVVVLVEPQLGENIGATARAMANFGLSRLRLVAPRQPWPNERARIMAAGADRILEAAVLLRHARSRDRRLQLRPRLDGARARSGQARGRRGRGGGADGAARRRRRNRRDRVRPRAQRARKPRGRARRPHCHAAGQSGVCLAQSGAGGGDRRL